MQSAGVELAAETELTPANSSAPISGVDVLLVAPSISKVTLNKGFAELFKEQFPVADKCKSVVETKLGSTFKELTFPPKPVAKFASVALALPI